LTAHGNERILDFARYLAKRRIPLWIRHVVVEGYTDDPEDLRALGRFIGGLDNLQALDVLPYHAMGEAKYRELGMDYPLAGLPALAKEKAIVAKGHIIEGIKEARKVK
jgi:pyruvate formate lyase activating enzyme